MALLSRGLDKIDDPEICAEMVKLWTTKVRDFREFFRTGDRNDSDFVMMKSEPRRKWIAAIVTSSASVQDDRIDSLSWDTYRLIKPEDFRLLVENLHDAPEDVAPAWAKTVHRMIRDERIRMTW